MRNLNSVNSFHYLLVLRSIREEFYRQLSPATLTFGYHLELAYLL